MKNLEEILKNYKDYKTVIEDRLGRRLCMFLTEEQAKTIGFEKQEGTTWPEPKEWTKENVLEQLKDDVDFGFEKALNQRGISASLMFEVVRGWNTVLEEGLEGWSSEDYAQYGLPLFKATAKKYGWDNPIGEDTGREFKYGVDDYWLDELCIPSLYYINDVLGLMTTGSREGDYKEKEWMEWEDKGTENGKPHITFCDKEKSRSFVEYLKERIPGSEIKEVGDLFGTKLRIVFPERIAEEKERKELWERILGLSKEYKSGL